MILQDGSLKFYVRNRMGLVDHRKINLFRSKDRRNVLALLCVQDNAFKMIIENVVLVLKV